jgi:hypothetical protein
MKEPVKASLVRMDAWIEKIKAEMKANHQKMDSCLGKTKASPETTDACPVKTEAKREPTPEEIEAVEEPQEVPEGATGEETIGAAKDRSRDLCLAVGCHGQLKTRTKRNGWVRQEYAATVGRPTRCTVPAMQEGTLQSCRANSGTRGCQDSSLDVREASENE